MLDLFGVDLLSCFRRVGEVKKGEGERLGRIFGCHCCGL